MEERGAMLASTCCCEMFLALCGVCVGMRLSEQWHQERRLKGEETESRGDRGWR